MMPDRAAVTAWSPRRSRVPESVRALYDRNKVACRFAEHDACCTEVKEEACETTRLGKSEPIRGSAAREESCVAL